VAVSEASILPGHLSSVRLFAYGSVVSGFLALTLTPLRSIMDLLVVGAMISLSWWTRTDHRSVVRESGVLPAEDQGRVREGNREGNSRDRVRRAMLVILTVASLLELVGSVGNATGGERLVLVLYWAALLLLFAQQGARTTYASSAIALLQLSVAAATTDDILFGPIVLVFITCQAVTLSALSLAGDDSGLSALAGVRPKTRTNDKAMPRVSIVPSRPIPRSALMGPAALTLVLLVVSTTLLFFIIPRYGAGFFFTRDRATGRRSGLANRLELGTGDPSQTDPRIVMRVDLVGHRGPYTGELRFRGAGLDFFDGRAWSAAPGRPLTYIDVKRGARDQNYTVNPPYGHVPKRLVQRIFIAEDEGVLLGASRILSVRGRFCRLERFPEDTLAVVFPAFTSRHYTCVSDIAHPSDRSLSLPRVLWGDPIRKRCLQLPKTLSRRVGELAHTITKEVSFDIDRIRAIERYLLSRFRYGAAAEERSEEDSPLETFLFESRIGDCELFAASMVVLLRTLGIPSRIATGYLSRTYNSVGGYYMVTGDDAHCWVEVLLPGAGWVDFDPTPIANPRTARTSWLSLLEFSWDALLMTWRRYVIDYQLLDQIDVLRTAMRLVTGFEWNAGWDPSTAGPNRKASPLLWIVAVVLACAIAAPLILRRAIASRERGQSSSPPGFYGELLALLESQGLMRRPTQTAWELAGEVRRWCPEVAETVEELTAAYCRVRFNEETLNDVDRRRISGWLADTKRVIHDRGSGRAVKGA